MKIVLHRLRNDPNRGWRLKPQLLFGVEDPRDGSRLGVFKWYMVPTRFREMVTQAIEEGK